MNHDRQSCPATGGRTPRAVVLLGVVIVSLVGCSADGRSGTDSVTAIEEAQAEEAAEVAEVQAAIDRQVEAADARRAAAQPAVVDTGEKAAADRAAAQKAAADRAAAQKAAADRAAAQRTAAKKPAVARTAPQQAAVSGAARTGTHPPQRTPAGSGKEAAPPGTGAKKVLAPRVLPPQPVAARPVRAATVPKPAVPKTQPAAARPSASPQSTLASPTDLHVVVAPGGAVTAPGNESVAAGCQPQDFHAGDPVRLLTNSGATVHETVLPACQREVIPAAGTGVAISSPRFFVTLPQIAWRTGDAWVLQIGTHRWPVTASTLSEYGWSIAVTARAGVTAGAPGAR